MDSETSLQMTDNPYRPESGLTVTQEIEGYKGLYSITSTGKVWNHRRNEDKKQHIDSRGYLQLTLTKNGKQSPTRVHIVVAKAFLGTPIGKLEINHKNGIKTDNRLNNLEWITHRQNLLHSISIGITPRGEKRKQSKLNKRKVLKALELRKQGFLYREIASRFGVTRQTISDALRGKNWKQVWNH